MTAKQKKQTPFWRIAIKFIKYLLFTIAISWTPMFFSFVIAKFFKLSYKELYLYFSEILFIISLNSLRYSFGESISVLSPNDKI